MNWAGYVGLLAVVGTSSHLLHSWIPDSEFSALFQPGKWLDLEGRVSQYAYSFLTGNNPDPSSTPFLLWTGSRLVAAALLLFGVTAEWRRGNWLQPYQLHLKLSLVLWLVTVAYCAVWTILAFSVGLIIAAGTYFVIFFEDPVEREQRLTRDTELASARRRILAAQQAREDEAISANTTSAPDTTPSVVQFLVTIQEPPLFFSIQNVTNTPLAGSNSTPSSAATEATSSPAIGVPTTPAALVSEASAEGSPAVESLSTDLHFPLGGNGS